MFADVIVSTEAEPSRGIARHYGAEVPFLRPPEMAGDPRPDIDWVRYTLGELAEEGAGTMLQPAAARRARSGAPRRSAAHGSTFSPRTGADSLRAVERAGSIRARCGCSTATGCARSSPDGPTDPPWHSMPYQSLPPVYVQNASLEIAWCRTVV